MYAARAVVHKYAVERLAQNEEAKQQMREEVAAIRQGRTDENGNIIQSPRGPRNNSDKPSPKDDKNKTPLTTAKSSGNKQKKDGKEGTQHDTQKYGQEAEENNEQEAEEDKIVLLPIENVHGIWLLWTRVANLSRLVLQSTPLNALVMGCICYATLSIGIQTYNSMSDNETLNILDFCVLGVFIFECSLKIIAEAWRPWIYFTDRKEWKWNVFDFAIIIMSLPVWGSALGGGNVAILRMLRLMRIMKLVKRIPQLYMIIMGLIGGLKSIGYIMLLLGLVFYLYAISGMYAWATNDPFHFRSVPIAMVTLFRMSTLENWSNVMNINYFGCDEYPGGYYTTDDPTKAENYLYCNVTELFGANATDSSISNQRTLNKVLALFYFVTFIVVSAFVMLSLFIGAITMSMTESMESMKSAKEEAERKERLEKAKKRALEDQKRKKEAANKRTAAKSMANNNPDQQEDEAEAEKHEEEKGLSNAEKRDRLKMRTVLMQTWGETDGLEGLDEKKATSNPVKEFYTKVSIIASKIVEHEKFVSFVTGVIILAGLLVGLQTAQGIVDTLGGLLTVTDSLILAVFTAEVILKIIAEGFEPWMYFTNAWNVFDFVIVVGSFTRGKGGMLTMLRLLRLLRVLKLVKAFPQLQVIVSALLKGLSSIGYIGLILLLCFYVFGIIGNILFADNDPYHFGQLHFAMISLFQCATMDGWSDVLYINFYGCEAYGYDDYEALGYKCTNKPRGWLATIYFLCFIVLGGMVLITLFVGVVSTSMEEATQEMDQEKEIARRIAELREAKGIDQPAVDSYMQVFHMLDLDGSGSVEEAELRIGLAAVGKYPSYEELREMMDTVDEDGSGQIDIVEFVEFMINVRAKSMEQKRLRELNKDRKSVANAAAGGSSRQLQPQEASKEIDVVNASATPLLTPVSTIPASAPAPSMDGNGNPTSINGHAANAESDEMVCALHPDDSIRDDIPGDQPHRLQSATTSADPSVQLPSMPMNDSSDIKTPLLQDSDKNSNSNSNSNAPSLKSPRSGKSKVVPCG